jgi:hypothetical protein
MMASNQSIAVSGKFEARYLAFLETVSALRPALHRYCARMTGSIMDGEDVCAGGVDRSLSQTGQVR